MPSLSTKIKWMLETGKDNICNSTGKEKESIMAQNLWSHQGLYRLDREGNKTTEDTVADGLHEDLELQNGASKAHELTALPCTKAEAAREGR